MTESPSTHNREGTVASVAGRLLVDGNLVKGGLVIDRGRIVDVRLGDVGPLPSPRLDAEIVSPGLVDLQVNGGFGQGGRGDRGGRGGRGGGRCGRGGAARAGGPAALDRRHHVSADGGQR